LIYFSKTEWANQFASDGVKMLLENRIGQKLRGLSADGAASQGVLSEVDETGILVDTGRELRYLPYATIVWLLFSK
jgi:hypothetical protein